MPKNDAGLVSDLADREARSPDSILAPALDAKATAPPGEHGEPTPDLGRTEAAVTALSARSAGIMVLAVLAVLYTLYFARDFFIPIVFAILLNALLSPVLRALARLRIPPPAGAAVVVLILLGAVGAGFYSLATPAQQLAASAPETLAKANKKLRKLIRPFRTQRIRSRARPAPSTTPQDRARFASSSSTARRRSRPASSAPPKSSSRRFSRL
jgi:hypothetical protein